MPSDRRPVCLVCLWRWCIYLLIVAKRRRHNKTPITKTSELNDRDFIISNIYKDLYWFLHVLELSIVRPKLLILYFYFVTSCDFFADCQLIIKENDDDDDD